MDVTALIGTAAGVVSTLGVPLAYLQWRDSRRVDTVPSAQASPGPAAALAEYTVLAPDARVRGQARPLIDRVAELSALKAGVRRRAPTAVIEGFSGIGKTALAAALCRGCARTHRVKWVFCAEKTTTLNLRSLAIALACDTKLPGARQLSLVAGASDTAAETLQDALTAFVAANRLLMVLDDFHTVRDPSLVRWASRMAHTEGRSTLVLTSRRHLHEIPRTADAPWIELRGLAKHDTSDLLAGCGLRVSETTLESIWRRAGEGNPQALMLFAGQAVYRRPDLLAVDLPAEQGNLDLWISPIYRSLNSAQQSILKAVAFVYEAASLELVRELSDLDEIQRNVAELEERFLLRRTGSGLELHSSLRDFVDSRLADDERNAFARRLNRWYRTRARRLFVEGLGADEPSYGLLYLESFPDYVQAEERHVQLVDDLLDRLADSGHPLPQDARILVLGAGSGIHDSGFVKHGLDVTNIEIQPEIAALGERRALNLNGKVRYIVADMSKGLPADIEAASMDAVFNIGSSFGYEDTDEDNAGVSGPPPPR